MPASADTAERYFSDGVTDELFVALARLPQIALLGRESARHFSSDSTDPRDVARRLGAEYLLELWPRAAGRRIHINADLVRGSDGTVAWSGKFDGALDSLAALQREIAQRIFDALEIKVVADQLRDQRHLPEGEAFDHYAQGRFFLALGSEKDIRRSLDHFNRAIQRDSLYAAPYAAAATAWNQLADAFLPPLEAYPKSDSLARRALQLDETNAEAHANVGYAAIILNWDWATARRAFLRAIDLNPSDAWARSSYSFYLQSRGELPAALAELRKATKLEPFVGYYGNVLRLMFAYTGHIDSALAEERRMQQDVPGYRYYGTSTAYMMYKAGRCADVVPLEQAAEAQTGRPTDMLVICLAKLGRRQEAEQALARMEARFKKQYFFPESIGAAAWALGLRERALEWFERGVALHSAAAPTFRLDPDMRPLLRDPRYRRVLATMRLDDVVK
jgi:TolB-like protein